MDKKIYSCKKWVLQRTPWPAARSSSSLSRAPKAKLSFPTRSRRRQELIMLTYGGLNGRVKAGDAEVAQLGVASLWVVHQCSSGQGNGWCSTRGLGRSSMT
jgi:hypothetical protein